MSNAIDPQMVRDNYARMSDEQLTRVATREAHTLIPEARDILRDELRKRNIDVAVANKAEQEKNEITLAELDAYCELLRVLPCPTCGGTDHKLNATLTSEVLSFLVLTHSSRKLKIACPPCLNKANNNALITSALLGWWGFPWGIIRTPMAIAKNISSKKQNKLETPNDYMRGFTINNIGLVEQHRNNPDALMQLIAQR